MQTRYLFRKTRGFRCVQLSVAYISKSAWWTFSHSAAILMANEQGGMAMSLGERIYRLRTENEMSQGELAEALEVSRQSVSKWETNGSVPELDKLIKLSEIFRVSLDELVLDKKQTDPTSGPEVLEQKVIYVQRHAPGSAQKVAGVVLLCFSALLWLMIALFGDVVAGLVLAAPFVGCGLICLFARKNAGLWCAWVVYLFIDIYLRFASGVNWQYVFYPYIYTGEWTIHLIVAWCLLAVFAVLTIVTALLSRKAYPGSIRSDLIGMICGWGAYVITWLVFALPAYEAHNAVVYTQLDRYLSAVSGWVSGIVMVVALVFTVRLMADLLTSRKKK